MSIFSTILDKLGLGPKDQAAKKPTPTSAAPTPAPVKPQAPVKPTPPPTPTPSKPVVSTPVITPVTPSMPFIGSVTVVDVVSKLDQMAKSNPQKLDWKVSIVDLLKLLGLDSSLQSRKELAQELGCPADKIGGDYSEMNLWLHKTVLQKIAANGGNIPPELYK